MTIRRGQTINFVDGVNGAATFTGTVEKLCPSSVHARISKIVGTPSRRVEIGDLLRIPNVLITESQEGRTTRDEFIRKQEELLKDLHPALASVLTQQAYMRSHSEGYDAVLATLEDLIHSFDGINVLLCRSQNA